MEHVNLPIYNDDCLITFSINCPHLVSVSVQDGRLITSHGVLQLFNNCRDIKELFLGFANIEESVVELVFKTYGYQLRKLQIWAGLNHSSSVDVFKQLILYCPNLEYLYNVPNLVSVMQFLESIPPKLERLVEIGFSKETNGPSVLNQHSQKSLLSLFKNLKKIV